MNLKKIKLKNFRNYRDEELDLEDNTYWVIRGANSAGKSTLACDSITYALFGKTSGTEGRKDLKVSADDVIRRGKNETEVMLKFEHIGDEYTIIRKRAKRGKGKGKETVTLYKNGKTILKGTKKTEADNWIRNNLWKYSDFINTTIILQDDMTRTLEMTTTERKEYIERLFGVDYYRDMAKIVNDRINSIEQKNQQKMGIIEHLKEEINSYMNLEDILEAQNIEYNKLQMLSAEKNKAFQTINDKYDKLNKILIEFNNLKNNYEENKKSLDKLNLDIADNDRTIHELELKYSKINDIEKKLVIIDKVEKKLEKLIEKDNQLKVKIKHKKSLNDFIKSERQNLEDKIHALKAKIKEYQAEVRNTEKNIAELNKNKEQIPIMEKRVSELEIIKNKLKELEKKEDELEKLKKDLAVSNSNLENETKTYKKELNDREKIIKSIPEIEIKLKDKKNARLLINKLDNELQELDNNLKECNDTINQLKNQIEINNVNIKNHKKKIKELEEERDSITRLEGKSTCPTCKQKLTPEHIQQISEKTDKEILEIKNKIKALDSNNKEIKIQINNEEKKVNTIKITIVEKNKEMENARKRADGIDLIEKQLKEAQEVESGQKEFIHSWEIRLKKIKDEIESIEKKINQIDLSAFDELKKQKDILSEEKIRLEELKKSVVRLGELEVKHNEYKKRINDAEIELEENKLKIENNDYAIKQREELKKTEEEINKLREELGDKPRLEKELSDLDPDGTRKEKKELDGIKNQIERLKGQLISNKKQKQKIIDEITKLETELKNERYLDIDTKLADMKEKYEESLKERDEAIKNETKLKSEIDNTKEKIKTRQEQEKKLEDINNEIGDSLNKIELLGILSKIFNKIGNRILYRLRASINLETIEILELLGNEQLKGITLTEEYGLDIETDDGYEKPGFFSGGQKVRIGFAFRIALSKVLANFTGAELQTIVIDEGGFGALDENGQRGVVEVLSTLEDKFKRMIIISHIDNIADNIRGIHLYVDNGKIVDKEVKS